MAKKPETLFVERARYKIELIPNSWFEKIQQKTIHGTPDFIGCINGLFIALEFKVGKNVADPLQEHKINKILACNGRAYVVYPENFNEVYQELLKISQLSLQ